MKKIPDENMGQWIGIFCLTLSDLSAETLNPSKSKDLRVEEASIVCCQLYA